MHAHDNSTPTAGDGARRRRPLLLSLAVLGAVTGLLGGLGVFADAFDRSTTGPNSYQTGDYVELDLQLATYDTEQSSCGEYSDDLVTGLFAVTDDELDLSSSHVERLCVRNVGQRAGYLDAGVIDVVDREIGCTGGESLDDPSCGIGAGELSSELWLWYSACDSEFLGSSTVGGGLPAHLLTLAPGQEVDDLCVEVRLMDTSPETLRRIQSDRAQWRFAFDLSAPDETPCLDDEWEPNEFTGEATDIGFDEPTPAVMCPDSQEDWYRFEHGGGPLRVDLDYEPVAGQRVELTLLSALNGWTATTTETGQTVEVADAAPGSYRIRVSGTATVDPLDYVLTVTSSPPCTDDPHEPNDVREAATGITVGDPVAGARCGDDDWFTFFKAPASAHLRVSLTFDDDQGDLDLGVYDAAGTLVATSDSADDEELITVQGQGAFYVLVYGYQGDDNPAYTLTLTALPTG